MCEPKYYGIEYEINPHMNLKNQAKSDLAHRQYSNLCDILTRVGTKLHFIEPQKGLPDMCFAANGAVVMKDKVIIAKFKHSERQGESQYYEEWFRNNGYTIIPMSDYCIFEGAGDALWSGRTMFVGYGQRSNVLSANRIVYELIGSSAFKNEGSKACNYAKDVLPLELVDPYFYHLDTCFCPLNKDVALIYEPAFHPESLRVLRKSIDLIPVPSEEAIQFACNAVIVDSNVVLPYGCDWTKKQLIKNGFKPHGVDMSEFIKAGGACKCLTLAI